jgi:hypothetical protein
MDFQSDSKEFTLSVQTNDIRKAVARTGSALYDFLEQALMAADEEDESDFLQFARETRNVLAIHAEQLSEDALWREAELEPDSSLPDAE